MQEVLDAIERHLGRSVRIAQLDYYQVIGLELYCDDPQQIRMAIQDATNRWMRSETGKYPESAQIIAKLLKQAQTILLDPEKRKRYDIQLEKLRRSQAESKPTAPQDTDDVGDLFPNSDPMAPFAFDRLDTSTSHRDSRCTLLDQVQDPQTRLAELEQIFPSLAELEYGSQMEEAEPSVPLASPRRGSGSDGTSLAQQIIRRRRRRRILVPVMLFLGSQAILVVSVWSYLRFQSQNDLKNKRIAIRQVEPGDTDIPSLPSIERGSQNSPRPEGNEGNQEDATDESDTRSSKIKNNPRSKPSPTNKTRQSPKPKPETPKPETPKPEPPMPAPTISDQPLPAMASDANTEESAEWKTLMANARGALDRADFDGFEKAIAQGVETSQTPLGRDQAARLDQLGQLYKIGVESFAEAKKKTHGTTSSIKVGGTEINIVESTPEKLILRSGKNESLSWDKLPFGIAIAFLDLTLDAEKPTDVAARAVFFSLAPQYRDPAKKSDILKKRIANWFEKSVGREEIRSDLPQALTDSFE